MKTISLQKGRQNFTFRYEPGGEMDIMAAIIDMVQRRDLDFDWFDASVMIHQLGPEYPKLLKEYLPKGSA